MHPRYATDLHRPSWDGFESVMRSLDARAPASKVRRNGLATVIGGVDIGGWMSVVKLRRRAMERVGDQADRLVAGSCSLDRSQHSCRIAVPDHSGGRPIRTEVPGAGRRGAAKRIEGFGRFLCVLAARTGIKEKNLPDAEPADGRCNGSGVGEEASWG